MSGIEPIKILLVEDDPGDQKLLKKSLESQRIANELHICSSAEEALKFLQKSCTEDFCKLPNLILLDLNMPGMGGIEFLKRIKDDDKLKIVPVVILTTSDSEKDILEGYKLQAAGYVTKPPKLVEFHNIISQITNYWFLICKHPQER